MNTRASSTFDWVLFAGLAVLFVLSQIFLNLGNLASGSPGWELVANIFILSIPLVLLYGSIALLVIAYRQRRRGQPFSQRMAGWLYWSPRVAGILIILFVSLFALDSFDGDASLWQKLGGFIIHLLPSFALAAFLLLTWRREWLGFWFFLAAAAGFFLLTVIGRPQFAAGNLILFVGPLLLIALLFGANWIWRQELRPEHRSELSSDQPASPASS